jgi:hypothetical protein
MQVRRAYEGNPAGLYEPGTFSEFMEGVRGAAKVTAVDDDHKDTQVFHVGTGVTLLYELERGMGAATARVTLFGQQKAVSKLETTIRQEAARR